MKIGAQLYTIRDYTKTPDDIAASFKKISDIGYTTVQVSGMGEIAAERLNEIAMENDLEIIVTHTNPDKILNDIDNVIKEHKIFGCSNVGIGALPLQYERSLSGYRAFIADYDTAAKKLCDNGMKLHYHNHAFEFERFDGVIPYDVIINETDPKLWGFIMDTYWIQFAGRNPAKQILDMSGRIDICHFKDLKIKDNKQYMAAVCEGNICFTDIYEACKATGVKYAMVEQDDCYGVNPFDELALSLKNINKSGL